MTQTITPTVHDRPYGDLPEATRKRRCEEYPKLLEEKAALLSNNQALHSRLETECAELDNLNEAQANKIVELKALNEELAGALEALFKLSHGLLPDNFSDCEVAGNVRTVLAKHKVGGK